MFGAIKMHFSEEPAVPLNFDKDFALPASKPTLLAQTNPHEMDDRIALDVASHTYYIDGVPAKMSVTSKVDSFFEPFLPEEAVKKMMNGRNWPREECK